MKIYDRFQRNYCNNCRWFSLLHSICRITGMQKLPGSYCLTYRWRAARRRKFQEQQKQKSK